MEKELLKIAIKIKQKREKMGMSYQELANKTGISKSTLQRYETGYIRNLPIDKFNDIAKALNITPISLMGWDDDREIKFSISAPKLGKIACGQPIETIEDLEWIEVEEKCDYVLEAKGDSMVGVGVFDGDLILLDKTQHLNNGEIGAICVGEDITLKKFYYYKEKRRIVLRAANPDYEDMIFDDEELEEIRVIGRAKLLTRKYKF